MFFDEMDAILGACPISSGGEARNKRYQILCRKCCDAFFTCNSAIVGTVPIGLRAITRTFILLPACHVTTDSWRIEYSNCC